MPVYDKLIINKLLNDSCTEFKDMDLDVVMEDMISYIKKMGGEVTETPNLWEIQCPYLWTGKIYKRFISFGVKPMMPNDSKIYYSLS